MLKKRIIPCLDIKDGRVVKGVNFIGIRDAGDPVDLAKRYVDEGADELVFLDITATVEQRKTLVGLVERVAYEINIPFTVGGGISSVEDARRLILAGADKVSLNSAAVRRPALITEIADRFGSQCTVVAIDAKQIDTHWRVVTKGGRELTPLHAIEWANESELRGAGEILLTSMSNDGTKSGFAKEFTERVSQAVNIPIIASGGAGAMQHFSTLFKDSRISAGLAASIFHDGEIDIPVLKEFLKNQQIPIR